MAARSIAKPLARTAVPVAAGTAKTVKAIAAVSRKAGEARQRMKATRRGTGRRFVAFVAGSGAGAAAQYLLDPADGKRRRHMLRDRTMATFRKGSRGAGRKARYAAGKAQGTAAETTSPGRDASSLNDPTLKAKVESELFRPADAPKDSVDITVERGVVFLRGEIGSRKQLEDLLKRAGQIDGVSNVENRLQVAGSNRSG